ncbi:type II toxin-antitoxin system PemK/MazF family toxin [Promicromonospora iranensis]|nr:type II toxin-antitoxin system PemK/MazF family toxin [Promicromonospora iranensis]
MIVQRGDVIWLSMDPTVGREQAHHRPHLVLSNTRQHRAMRLAIVVPMTSTDKSWPTRVEVAPGSYAICEQPRTVSLERVTRHDPTGHDTTAVAAILHTLIDPS